MIYINQAEFVKNTLENLVGETIRIKANRGRNKSFLSTGKILSVHPNLFIFESADKHGLLRKYSFCYSDVLTSNVKFTRLSK